MKRNYPSSKSIKCFSNLLGRRKGTCVIYRVEEREREHPRVHGFSVDKHIVRDEEEEHGVSVERDGGGGEEEEYDGRVLEDKHGREEQEQEREHPRLRDAPVDRHGVLEEEHNSCGVEEPGQEPEHPRVHGPLVVEHGEEEAHGGGGGDGGGGGGPWQNRRYSTTSRCLLHQFDHFELDLLLLWQEMGWRLEQRAREAKGECIHLTFSLICFNLILIK